MPNLNSTTDSIEALAKIEHEQWTHWSQAVAGEVADATRSKWRRSWVEHVPSQFLEFQSLGVWEVTKLKACATIKQ
jgi:hypothetical protein